MPDGVRQHFETAKNVLFYAWFVYRFHMVAEQYVLTTLEFALRERLLQDKHIQPTDDWVPPLKRLIVKAREAGLITNERFAPGADLARRRAEHRHSIAMIRRMEAENLTEFAYDPAELEITEEDRAHDWIQVFEDSLPSIRNMHAHGTPNLYPTVFTTFRIVHNLIQQAFSSHHS